ncbi:amidohydrolase family protein [Flagellimonas myxillae]|uniref:amidohydrolase family protein n=1 Tax=Flagellimonas myxillae TaxID=2942214 RepID=UPI00201F5464|nr:amidohydrolase family protein [Muricauda myxillae]MCL6267099.1 amidohydrolase family protein [Muricauda myxillae]
MIIDSHQHFWNYDAERHAWIDDEMANIRRSFLPEELKKTYAENNIDGCVAVQADQTLEETDFLLDLASGNDFVKGVVGWVDLRSISVEEDLEKYQGNPFLKGWRHIVQGEQDHNFLLRPNFTNGISLLEKYGYTYDILVFPHQLGAVLEFVKQFPNQKFVIDHIAKPYIKDGYYDGWAVLMQKIAEHENVHCKLSGMVTEADYKNWEADQFTRYINLVLEAFGPKRIMYGSDWPVCLVAASYQQAMQLTTDAISGLSENERNQIMGTNALAFYNL